MQNFFRGTIKRGAKMHFDYVKFRKKNSVKCTPAGTVLCVSVEHPWPRDGTMPHASHPIICLWNRSCDLCIGHIWYQNKDWLVKSVVTRILVYQYTCISVVVCFCLGPLTCQLTTIKVWRWNTLSLQSCWHSLLLLYTLILTGWCQGQRAVTDSWSDASFTSGLRWWKCIRK